VLRATEELQSINRAAFIRYQADLAGLHGAAERATWQRLGIALALSLSIAIVATLYASRLERRLLAQLAKDALNTRALQHLSTKLINAQEAERGRIARELHDDVGQALSAIKVELAVAQRRIETTGSSDDLLEPAQLITDGALQTVRDLSHLLHPVALDDLGLAAAVDSYLRDFSKRTGIRVHLQQDDMTGRLAPEIEVAVYRIIQEALTNVARHAEASACRVNLHRTADTLVVTVDDDGRGFDPSKATQSPRSGLGLLGMRERVSQLGGSVLLTSVIGQGTTVRIECPAIRRDESLSIEAAEAASSELRPQSAHG
jgi:signal transduction histidine kinase